MKMEKMDKQEDKCKKENFQDNEKIKRFLIHNVSLLEL